MIVNNGIRKLTYSFKDKKEKGNNLRGYKGNRVLLCFSYFVPSFLFLRCRRKAKKD